MGGVFAQPLGVEQEDEPVAFMGHSGDGQGWGCMRLCGLHRFTRQRQDLADSIGYEARRGLVPPNDDDGRRKLGLAGRHPKSHPEIDDGDDAPPHVDHTGNPGRCLGEWRDVDHADHLDHVLDRQRMLAITHREDKDLDAVEVDRAGRAGPGIAAPFPGRAASGFLISIIAGSDGPASSRCGPDERVPVEPDSAAGLVYDRRSDGCARKAPEWRRLIVLGIRLQYRFNVDQARPG